MYERIYSIERPVKQQVIDSHKYIRIQPFANDQEYPDYDADKEDDRWLDEQRKLLPADYVDDLLLHFEEIMDRLEKATTHSMSLMSPGEAHMLLLKSGGSSCFDDIENHASSSTSRPQYKTEREEFTMRVYEYWRTKRLKFKHPLTPIVLTDKSLGAATTAPNNPFLVFRRRTEKMQTRKNRKNEEQSYEKMLILKRDLQRAQNLLKSVRKRETHKKDLLRLTLESFEKRFKLSDYDGSATQSILFALRKELMAQQQPLRQQQQQQLQQQSLLDKKIARMIQTNDLKGLASPPSGSFKGMANANLLNLMNKKPALAPFTVNNASAASTTSSLNEKRRLKKERMMQQQQQPFQQLLINNNNNKNNKFTGGQQQQQASPYKLESDAALALKMQQRAQQKNQLLALQQQQHKQLMLLLRGEASGTAAAAAALSLADFPYPLSEQQRAQLQGELAQCSQELVQLEGALNEIRNQLSTSVEKDGYWCFKRKEGCKYLAQTGSLFKNDVSFSDDPAALMISPASLKSAASVQAAPTTPKTVNNTLSPTGSSSSSSLMQPLLLLSPTGSASTTVSSAQLQQLQQQRVAQRNDEIARRARKEERMRSLRQTCYGYAVTKRKTHLGLVRRRIARGGRVVFERFNQPQNLFAQDDEKRTFSFDFSKFKTYYPSECFRNGTQATFEVNTNADEADETEAPEDSTDRRIESIIDQVASSVSDEATVAAPAIVEPQPNPVEQSKKLVLKSFMLDSSNVINNSDEDSSDESDLDDDDDEQRTIYDHHMFATYQMPKIRTTLKHHRSLSSSSSSSSSSLRTEDEDATATTTTTATTPTGSGKFSSLEQRQQQQQRSYVDEDDTEDNINFEYRLDTSDESDSEYDDSLQESRKRPRRTQQQRSRRRDFEDDDSSLPSLFYGDKFLRMDTSARALNDECRRDTSALSVPQLKFAVSALVLAPQQPAHPPSTVKRQTAAPVPPQPPSAPSSRPSGGSPQQQQHVASDGIEQSTQQPAAVPPPPQQQLSNGPVVTSTSSSSQQHSNGYLSAYLTKIKQQIYPTSTTTSTQQENGATPAPSATPTSFLVKPKQQQSVVVSGGVATVATPLITPSSSPASVVVNSVLTTSTNRYQQAIANTPLSSPMPSSSTIASASSSSSSSSASSSGSSTSSAASSSSPCTTIAAAAGGGSCIIVNGFITKSKFTALKFT